jgi:carbamoyl-phosphate synthase small subunit
MDLHLEDGTEFIGEGFGANRAAEGEVVFNTAMAGYIETLTDPSYRGQILVCTYPLIGNYGVPAPRLAQSIAPPYESSRIQVQGLVVQNYVDHFSHGSAARSLSDWLQSEGVPALSGVDTRAITRQLREHGTMSGILAPQHMSFDEARKTASRVEMEQEVFRVVAPNQAIRYPAGERTVMVVDIGAKDNIVRSLLNYGVSVLRVPWYQNLPAYLDQVDGVLIGNGPGDPANLVSLVEQVKGLLALERLPVFGICLGHQILSLAAGAKTYKLPYGHRGVNQPVQDLLSRRCFITSQNHGFAVDEQTLPHDWEPWFININDGTNEGVRCKNRPYFSVRFHPEGKPGPEDTAFLFEEFLRTLSRPTRG